MPQKKIIFLFYLLFVFGIIGLALTETRLVFLLSVPYVLLLCAVLMIANTVRSIEPKWRGFFSAWCLSVFLLTLFLEFVGVHLGWVFGAYRYLDVLGIKVGGVPLIIGVNWLTTILGAISFFRKYTHRKIYIILGTGIIAVAFDYLLESVAIYLGFWEWAGPIPWHNYMAWFTIAMLCALDFERHSLSFNGSYARALLAAQVLFFLGIRFVMSWV